MAESIEIILRCKIVRKRKHKDEKETTQEEEAGSVTIKTFSSYPKEALWFAKSYVIIVLCHVYCKCLLIIHQFSQHYLS